MIDNNSIARKKLLHITFDHPDSISKSKTKAVRNLIVGAENVENFVYSFNRIRGFSGIYPFPSGANEVHVVYAAPDRGIFLKTYLRRLAEWMIQDIKSRGWTFDAVHAHKLTIDGVIGYYVAEALNIPLLASARGDTDLKVMDARFDLVTFFKKIANRCAKIMPVAPYTEKALAAKFGLPASKFAVMPAITGSSDFSPSDVISEPRLVTLFHLDSHARKGIVNLIKALQIVSRQYPDVSLDIYGGGSPSSLFKIRQLMEENRSQKINLMGPAENSEVSKILKGYAGFVLPTKRETFGMVFIEALMAGVPVLHSKGRGIDGLFPDHEIGIGVDPSSVSSIAEGIIYLLQSQAELKRRLADAAAQGRFDPVKPASVHASYNRVLQDVWSR